MISKKIISLVAALSITASMAMPVFATEQNTQNSNVPVVGKVGRWNGSTTNPDNPTGGGGGGEKPGEIPQPPNVSSINVSVPTSMTFNIVTNTTNGEPNCASGTYEIKNNGNVPVNVTGTYTDTSNDGITLVKNVTPNVNDGQLQLALKLKSGTDTENINTDFMDIVNNEKSSQALQIERGGKKLLKFVADKAGMADIAKAADQGDFATTAKTMSGKLVLTFNSVDA